MIVYKTIVFIDKGKEKKIYFGIPDKKEELEDMFALRYKVYTERGHIRARVKNPEIDKDYHDHNGECIYFVARYDNRTVGSLRLIIATKLPTESDYFRFDEPESISAIDRNKRIEVGRIISVKPNGKHFPRHLIMLTLFSCAVDYAKKNGFEGGYGSLKEYVKNKLDNIKFPINEIKNYEQIYDARKSKDPLNGFFDPLTGPVYPVYFLRDSVKKYLDNIFNSRLVFDKMENNEIFYKGDRLLLLKLLSKKIGF